MNKTGAVVLALIVGGVIGFVIGTAKGGHIGPAVTPAQKCLTPNNQIVDVTLKGTPSCPDAILSKGNNDEIIWQSPPDTSLWISFPNLGSSASGANNTKRYSIPANYTPNQTPTPIVYDINVFDRLTPTPAPGTPRPTPQSSARIIIMK